MTDQAKIQTAPELISPAAQGQINSAISGAIKEAMLAMTPIFQSIALTPEKIREANAPWVDEKAKLREIRERALMKEDLDEARRNTERVQKNCPGPHRDANGRFSVSLIHNYPDRQVRGICTHCYLLIEPTHWEIGPPDAQNPRGKAHLVKAHPLYHIVAEVQQIAGQM